VLCGPLPRRGRILLGFKRNFSAVTLAPSTFHAALHTATAALAKTSETPRRDAELLLAHATGLTPGQIRAREQSTLDASCSRRLQAAIARRVRGEPIAYILGEWEFWSLPLEVTPDVLVPRPETELLVELALARFAATESRAVLDLGTGSGAIAIAIASERPHASVTAVDRSSAALAVAARNVERHVRGRVELIESDWFEQLAGRRYDLIVGNPPYIATADPALEANVAAHEPALALFAGRAGLDALEAIVTAAPRHLECGGSLLLEHGHAQDAAVRARFHAAGYAGVVTTSDLAGHARVTAGVIPAAR